MISENNLLFTLSSRNTTYAFRVLPTGHLEHLYYGRKINTAGAGDALSRKQTTPVGNTISYSKDNAAFTLEAARLEMSAYGKGDIREPFIELVHSDGSFTSDFLYDSYEIKNGRDALATLPSSYGTVEEAAQLKLILKDKNYGLTLELYYYVYEDRDVIGRGCKLINNSHENVTIRRIMSMLMDIEGTGYVFTTFNGAWAREMGRHDTVVTAGKHINSSYTGTSSSRANPFVMLSDKDTTENHGKCIGLNLIYSGNHYEAVEAGAFGTTRIVTGINPQSFNYVLEPGSFFESPEAVITFSDKGYNGLSHNMHEFVRRHIVRGKWQYRERPVLLNSWEAAYFKINEKKLYDLAKAGRDVGIELLVMDDGWFGERDDDSRSLGDWYVNTKKLPKGLKGICDKVNGLGMDFGIWVEPEMVNVNSNLYRRHPEWVIANPKTEHSEGRNQRLLDLCNPDVRAYIIEEMTKVFSSANIAYVKWDMNRIFSDYYSQYLPKERQGEVAHRYIMGLYEVMAELTKSFPDILFEGCSAGGNRFDLGILCYFPQIWASDNTDAVCRAYIQEGLSYGYPMSVVSAHVSACPNHQTLRETPLSTRFNVAAFGICGYECNLVDMKKEELAEIKEQISIYKQWRHTLQFGTFHRQRTGNIHQWTVAEPDGSRAVGMIMQELVKANTQNEMYYAAGLKEDTLYHIYNRKMKYNVKEFGDLINTASPVHIKQGSLLHNVVERFVTMQGETEDYELYGDMLMDAGIQLKQAFAATGYSEEVRHFPDFASRMYFIEEFPKLRSDNGIFYGTGIL